MEMLEGVMGPGQDSAESSLCLATAPYADGDFTCWLSSQWKALKGHFVTRPGSVSFMLAEVLPLFAQN